MTPPPRRHTQDPAEGPQETPRQDLRDAVTLAVEAAEIGRKVGLMSARMAAETGMPGVFNDAAAHGLKCRDWRIDLEEYLRQESRAPEVLELCSAALRDISDAYAAAARAIKVTEAMGNVTVKV